MRRTNHDYTQKMQLLPDIFQRANLHLDDPEENWEVEFFVMVFYGVMLMCWLHFYYFYKKHHDQATYKVKNLIWLIVSEV